MLAPESVSMDYEKHFYEKQKKVSPDFVSLRNHRHQTEWSASKISTHKKTLQFSLKGCGPTWARTRDQKIMSLLL